MAPFPGENNDAIPKRIVDAISKQPLNHIVPKDEILSMDILKVHPTIIINNHNQKNVFDEDDLTNVIKSELSEVNEISNNDPIELKFKYPEYVKMATLKSEETNPQDIMDGLSSETLQYITSRKIIVESSDITQIESPEEKTTKRTFVDGENSTILDDSITEQQTKKAKISSNVSLNQENIGLQYLQDLEKLLSMINSDKDNDLPENTELWYSLVDNQYTLSVFCLNKILSILQDISNIPQIWSKLNVESLIKLLNSTTDNIQSVRELSSSDDDTIVLTKIGLLSISISFTIFLFNLPDKKIYLEEFIMEPIEFLTQNMDFEESSHDDDEEEMIQLIANTLSLIPKYIEQKQHIDEALITRFVYIFSEILMNDNIQLGSTSILNNIHSQIKFISSSVFVSLFNKIPSQREFILDELLSHAERLPQKRLQKKLVRLDNNTFITYFTLTILKLLEGINYYDYIYSLSTVDNDIVDVLNYHKKVSSEQIEEYIDHIVNYILDRMFNHLAKYKHCLENFAQDLTNALLDGSYPVSEKLLNILVSKMLEIFRSSKKYNANIETTCLQQLGNIAGIMFDIKRQTKQNEANNLIKICNYPDMLPQWLESFSKYVTFVKKNSCRSSAFEYAYCMEMNSLLQLYDLMKDTISNQQETKETIFNAVKVLIQDTAENHKDVSFEVVKYHYYSILHSFELINLYEPYLQLVLSILEQDKIKLRSIAIKSLSILITKDNSVLSSPLVKVTITNLLTNPSAASIKDAILDLLTIGSTYVKFYREINVNYDSDSLQVRRHILRLNGMIYDETDETDIKIYVASRILLKIEDEEDNIIDIARNSILHRWIESISEFRNQPEKEYNICVKIIEVISGVISSSEKCSDLFSWYLNFYLLNSNSHEPSMYSEIKDNLKILTNALVQMIIELQADEREDEEIKLEKQRLLNLLSIFSDSIVPFISKDHIIGLYPYMVSDTRSTLYYHILHTFRSSMEKLTNFKPKFLYDLETTLLTALPKMTVKEIDEAIPLAWHVANQRNDFGRLTKACSSCFTLLNPYINLVNTNSKKLRLDSKLQRLLYLATGFARFTQFDTSTTHIASIPDGEPIHEYVAKCMLLLSRTDIDHVIRRIAIKNLTRLCSNHPRLFYSKHILKLMDNEFKSKNLDIQLVILESFYDFLIKEEKSGLNRSGENSYQSSNKESSKLPKGNQMKEFLNDGISSGLVTRYLQSILRICLLSNFKNALVAIRLLKLILEYGYTIPSHCVPTVVALLSSPNMYVKKVTTVIFTTLMEKYETMVYSGLPKGILMGIRYTGNCEPSNYYKFDKFFSLLQKNMTTSRGSVAKFNKRLFNILDMILAACLNEVTMHENIHIILFISTNITNIKFQDQYELLTFIKKIDAKSEQLKEIAYSHGKMNIDTNDLLENSSLKSNVRDMVISSTVLQQLQKYLINLYSLKEEVLLYDEIQEDELRGRAAVTNKTVSQGIQILIEKTYNEYQKDDELIDYLDNLD